MGEGRERKTEGAMRLRVERSSKTADKKRADDTGTQKIKKVATPQDKKEKKIATTVIKQAKEWGLDVNDRAERIGELILQNCFTFPESDLDPPQKRAALTIVFDHEDDLGLKKSTLFSWIAVARQKRWCKARGADISKLPPTHQTELTRMRETDPAKLDLVKEVITLPSISSRNLMRLVKERKTPTKPRKKTTETQAPTPADASKLEAPPTEVSIPSPVEIDDLINLLTDFETDDFHSLDEIQNLPADKREEVIATVDAVLLKMKTIMDNFDGLRLWMENSKRLENESEGSEQTSAAPETAPQSVLSPVETENGILTGRASDNIPEEGNLELNACGKNGRPRGGVRHKDSVQKIVGYFAAITKVPFTLNGKNIEPLPLYVSDKLAQGYTCIEHGKCGACCEKFTLDYLPDEKMPAGTTSRLLEFNGQQIEVFRDEQKENAGYYCKHLNLTDGPCQIHDVNPLSCKFELIRHYDESNSAHRHRLGVAQYGRFWNMTRIDGTLGAPCKTTPTNEDSIKDTIDKLEQLQKWAEHFRLTETHIPEMIQLLRDNGLKKWKETLFPKDWTDEQREKYWNDLKESRKKGKTAKKTKES